MKKSLYCIAALLPFLFASCEKESGKDAERLSAAETASGSIEVNLRAYTPVDLIWTAGEWNGEGEISYRAVIDAENGDFSAPLLSLTPMKGTLSVFITKEQMNSLWEKVQTGGTSAVVKWAVETSAGGRTLISDSQNIVMNKAAATLTPAAIEDNGVDIEVDMKPYQPFALEWSAGRWDDDDEITYRVLVDVVDGTFEEPVLVVNPAEGALSVTISADDIKTIWDNTPKTADDMDIVTAVAKWTVETSVAGKVAFAEPQRIVMTKGALKLNAGLPIYAAGEGAKDAGQSMNYITATVFNKDGGTYNDNQNGGMDVFDYEIFTEVEAGRPFCLSFGANAAEPDGYISFIDPAVGVPFQYELSEEMQSGVLTVENTSVYRIRLNVAESRVLVQKVGAVQLRCFGRELNDKGKWAQATATNFDMTYLGYGRWELKDFDVKWGNSTFAKRFDTYKFSVNVGGKDQLYGKREVVAENPAKDTDKSYWALQPCLGGGVTDKGAVRLPEWLLSETDNPAWSVDVILHLNLDNGGYYYHELINETAK